eukprot:TRINITY_DN7558_c0_g1_i1.p1 TRINITY_DN7558_c0_g1~~TRINITY_DN7558_c0_g1_i1.p1  ORF type:complete len:217 (-),score=54.08 TRINITY_DN7558_c0_g1_i1:38-688(-)
METDNKVHILRSTNQVTGLLTIIRDINTTRENFIFYSDRLIRLIIEEALSLLPFEPKQVTTPTGAIYDGIRFTSPICGVSVVRAGESMERGLREVVKAVRIGKILIQRNDNADPILFFAKFPEDISTREVLLLDPMLATGGTACKAIQVLLDHDVDESKIYFLNLISSPEGIEKIHSRYPQVRIVTAAIDQGLDDKKYIVPGCGDFGDRYFGTVDH